MAEAKEPAASIDDGVLKAVIEGGELSQFCTFYIADRMFAVDIVDVREINMETDFTPIFHAPKEVCGYVNIRGQIYLVLDLSMVFSRASTAVTPQSRLVLFKDNVGESFGVLVDRVGDVVQVARDSIEDRRQRDQSSTPDSAERRESRLDALVVGVCKLDDELLIVLDARQLLTQLDEGRSASGAST